MAGKQADIKVGVLTNYDDSGIKQAKTGLAGFKSSIDEADGAGGKLKAGFSSVKESVIQNAGALALGAGAALVSFGIKAVGAFTDTAKSALDLSTSTGLAVEDASRWIGVGDDFQVGADQLVSGLGKIAKTLDASKWKTYGIETHDAGGKARDVNDILLDTFDMLSKVDNQTERARIGNDLFGKGYANLSPLIGHTREEYEKMLGSVEKGQVITKAEAEKAEKFRLAEDNLKDALHEVTLSVGEQVAGLAPLLEGMAKYIGFVDRLQGSGILPNPLQSISSTIENVTDTWDRYTGALDRSRDAEKLNAAQTAETARETAKLTSGLDEQITAEQEAEASVRNSQNALDGYSYAAKDAKDTIAGLQARNKMMTDDLERGLNADKQAMDNLLGIIDDDEAWLNLQNNIAATTALFDENGNVIVKKGEDGAQALRDAALAVDGLKKDVIQYGTEVLGLPTQKITDIIAAVNPQNLADIEALLANLTRNRNVSLSIVAKGGAGYGDGPRFAEGGVVPGPVGAPMAATVHGGEMVLTPEQQAAVGGGGSTATYVFSPTINGANLTPAQLVAQFEKFIDRNGPGVVKKWVGSGVSGGTP